MTFELEPLVFEPLLKQRAWGGDRLRRLGKRVPAGVRIGESWELADLPLGVTDGRSHIACGPWSGKSLREVLNTQADAIMGLASLSDDGGFPLLVKYLDANEHLSIQVHPDAAFAAATPGASLKSEAWIVLDAAPGAIVYRGVKLDVDRERFFSDLQDPKGPGIVPHLNAVSVERGDCIYLPSGICHALGAGLLVAEVQTPSDTTFRVFDWGRHDPARPLHLEQARRCMRFGTAQEDRYPGIVRRKDLQPFQTAGFQTRSLCRTPFFEVEWIDVSPNATLPVVTNDVPVVWSVLEGSAELAGPNGRALRIRHGDTVLMPARLQRWSARFPEPAAVLRSTLPSPTDRILA